MSEPVFPDDSRDEESLADQPLMPVEDLRQSTPSKFTGMVMLVGAAAAAAFMFVGSTTTACRGSTRTSRLIWEQRQLEIEQAANNAESDQPDCDERET